MYREITDIWGGFYWFPLHCSGTYGYFFYCGVIIQSPVTQQRRGRGTWRRSAGMSQRLNATLPKGSLALKCATSHKYKKMTTICKISWRSRFPMSLQCAPQYSICFIGFLHKQLVFIHFFITQRCEIQEKNISTCSRCDSLDDVTHQQSWNSRDGLQQSPFLEGT